MNALPVRYWFSSVGGPRMFSTSRGVMPTSTLASGVLAGGATAARVGRSGSGALCAEHAISTDRNAIETKGTRLLPIPHLLLFATAVYAAVRRLARDALSPPMAAISSAPTCARSRSPYRQQAQRAFRRSLTPRSVCANTGSGSCRSKFPRIPSAAISERCAAVRIRMIGGEDEIASRSECTDQERGLRVATVKAAWPRLAGAHVPAGRVVAKPAGRQQSHGWTPAEAMRQPSEESGGQSPLAGYGCLTWSWPVWGCAKCRHSRLLGSAIGTSSHAGLVLTSWPVERNRPSCCSPAVRPARLGSASQPCGSLA